MRSAIHEMQNYLCVAMAGIETFLDRKLEPNEVRLRAVFAALREVTRLIDDLPSDRTVTFPTQNVPIDVCCLIACQVAAMEGFAVQRDVRLTVDGCTLAHAETTRFVGDPMRIAEIVTNVVMNAIRYTPPGGEVHVAYQLDPAKLRLSVSDDGPGVDIAERSRIFEHGYRGRTSAFPPGSGIGLALVKQFVDGQGGTIVVSDGPRSGALFSIELPGRFASKPAANVVAASFKSRRLARPAFASRPRYARAQPANRGNVSPLRVRFKPQRRDGAHPAATESRWSFAGRRLR